MRLHMDESHAQALRRLGQRCYLLPAPTFPAPTVAWATPAVRIFTVRIARIRADGDVELFSGGHCLPHRVLVAGLAAAGHVCRSDVARQLEIGTTGQRFRRLSQVGVEVDFHGVPSPKYRVASTELRDEDVQRCHNRHPILGARYLVLRTMEGSFSRA